ncbi:hypothetical protein GUJ93_ZPchr0001g31817 [Zizania palustris]|uniref:Uncharacterized protein n=1 Tax=Zizania palustris TaxID=103762 RepID=A0A8J5RPZ3_ZIZPA|nr:hypothetical protein GUJ93_ZPchr0001g31817 [Zizania palustris]
MPGEPAEPAPCSERDRRYVRRPLHVLAYHRGTARGAPAGTQAACVHRRLLLGPTTRRWRRPQAAGRGSEKRKAAAAAGALSCYLCQSVRHQKQVILLGCTQKQAEVGTVNLRLPDGRAAASVPPVSVFTSPEAIKPGKLTLATVVFAPRARVCVRREPNSGGRRPVQPSTV